MLLSATDVQLSPGRDGRVAAGFRPHFQTRAFAGASTHTPSNDTGMLGDVSLTALAAAKAHLEAFDLVMTVDTLARDAAVLAHVAGWKRANMTAARRGSREQSSRFLASLDTDTRRLLDLQAGMDDALYDHAVELNARMRGEVLEGITRHRLRQISCEVTPTNAPALHTSGSKCNRGAESLIAACAVAPPGYTSSRLLDWVLSLNATGMRRVYLHLDGAGDDRSGAEQVRVVAIAALTLV